LKELTGNGSFCRIKATLQTTLTIGVTLFKKNHFGKGKSLKFPMITLMQDTRKIGEKKLKKKIEKKYIRIWKLIYFEFSMISNLPSKRKLKNEI